jgi:hypothetical protein
VFKPHVDGHVLSVRRDGLLYRGGVSRVR